MTRVVVYTKPGCHLCEDACAAVARIAGDAGVDWAALDITGDDALMQQWSEYVPVIVVFDSRDGGMPLPLQAHPNPWCRFEVAHIAGIATLLGDDPQGGAGAGVADNRATGLPALASNGLQKSMTRRQAEPGHGFDRGVEQIALDEPCASTRAGVVSHPIVLPGSTIRVASPARSRSPQRACRHQRRGRARVELPASARTRVAG